LTEAFAEHDRDRAERAQLAFGDRLERMIQECELPVLRPPATYKDPISGRGKHQLRGRGVAIRSWLDDEQVSALGTGFRY
jgi:hypothetical protein